MIPLLEIHPSLKKSISYIALGTFPTPVQKLAGLSHEIGSENLFIKRDDQTGNIWGGNKVRKLEFLLGKAVKDGVKTIVTSGGAGSNHAFATALYAKNLGIKSILMLAAQPNAQSVQKNLFMDLWIGAELHHSESFHEQQFAIKQIMHDLDQKGKSAMLIPPGGSSPLGALGFVNAGLELKEQVDKGEMPEPDVVFAAMGTMATTVGLSIGLRAAGLKTKVIGVRVVPEFMVNKDQVADFHQQIASLLRENDSAFPDIKFDDKFLSIEHNYFGKQYGLYSQESVDAVKMIKKSDDITFDGTYTGKALAAFINHAKKKSNDEILLFWNTLNSRPYPDEAISQDYHRLPVEFHRYFETEVQELDRE
jgi:1-aminocyclopropane-1-carboxylate deaminase/D-cysteine desulfhydrase-like pyridoxal-dependent ACC family enzyme